MKTVVRLIVLYFTCSPLARGISIAGLLAVVVGGAGLLHYFPRLTTMVGIPSGFSLAEELVLTVTPLAGTLALFFGSALLPAIVGRFASGRQICVLPHGRSKLFASALLTTLLLTLVTSATSLIYYVYYPIPLGTVFRRAFVITFVTYSALYVALWLFGRFESAAGMLAGALLVLAALLQPVGFEGMSDGQRHVVAAGVALLWCAFGIGFLVAPRWRAWSSERRARIRSLLPDTGSPYASGGELELVLGIDRPWLLALGQLLPLGAAAILMQVPQAWYLYFTILSALAGGVASTAATRSRALWLRTGWDRAQLFARVERAYWRHGAYALGVPSLLLVGFGVYAALPTSMLVAGMLTLALGLLACMYLGLMMTHGIGWAETLIAVATMALLMAAAVWSADGFTVATLALEAALLALIVAFRFAAKRRWHRLDWLLCRPERTARSGA